MGKGHGDKKKINDLIAEGNIKGAKDALATSKKRLSRAAHAALTKHLQNKLRIRKKMGAKKYAKMVKTQRKKLSAATKAGIKKNRDSRAFAAGVGTNTTSIPGGVTRGFGAKPSAPRKSKGKSSGGFYEGSSGGTSVAGGLPSRAAAAPKRSGGRKSSRRKK